MKQHKLNPKDFEMDEIVSIELIGEHATVDITVADVHMFYADDIYTHNSAIDHEIIQADSVGDSYKKVQTADFIMSVSRKTKDKLSNTGRIHIVKNRFGPDGMTFPSKIDTFHGIMDIFALNSAEGVIATKDSKNGENLEKKLLHKKYVDNMG